MEDGKRALRSAANLKGIVLVLIIEIEDEEEDEDEDEEDFGGGAAQ